MTLNAWRSRLRAGVALLALLGGAARAGDLFPVQEVRFSADGRAVLVESNPESWNSAAYYERCREDWERTANAALERAVAQGGQIALPRQALPPGMGFFAHIHDLDGNRVGLHAMN